MAHISISDAAQRYIDDRINADHIATRAIALSITTCGAPRVYTGNITETRIFIKRGENVDEAIAKAFSIEDEQDTTTTESIEEQEETMKTTTTKTTKTTTTAAEEQEDIMSNQPIITATKPITTTDDGKEVYLDDVADLVILGNSRHGKAVVDLCLSVKYQPAFRVTFDGVAYIVPGGEYIISCTDANAPEKGDFQITVPAGHNIAATIHKSIERLYTDDVERAICERFERMLCAHH